LAWRLSDQAVASGLVYLQFESAAKECLDDIGVIPLNKSGRHLVEPNADDGRCLTAVEDDVHMMAAPGDALDIRRCS